ncbi:hypothetical protein CHUAL_010672 [Chamberlinius hualienensis]
MAEVVDLIREYSKEFIMYPINERFDKMEYYFNQKLEQLINSNIHKSNEMDRTLEANFKIQSNDMKNLQTIQVNMNDRLNKFEGKCEFIDNTNEAKNQQLNERFNQKEIQLNGIINHFEKSLKKLSKDLSEFDEETEHKNKQFTESIKQNTIKIRQLNENIDSIKNDLQKISPIFNEEMAKVKTRIVDVTNNLQYEIDSKCDKLQLEMKDKEKENCKKFEKIDEKFNNVEYEKRQMNDVLVTAVTAIDEQNEISKCLKTDATDKWLNLWTKVDYLEEDVKEMTSRLELPIGEFLEEKMSSYIKTHSPDLSWKINGIKKIIKENLKLKSQSFELIGYQVKAQVSLTVNALYIFIHIILEGDSKLLKLKPSVTFILKDLSGNERHIIKTNDVYYGRKDYDGPALCSIPLINQYVMNDSIAIDIHFEPSSICHFYASTNGILLWKIKNYRQKKQDAIDGLAVSQPSPHFLTSSNGYHVMGYMGLNGFYNYIGKGLSICMVFLNGENDSTIIDSFVYNTTVILFNQLDSTKNCKKTVENNIKRDPYYFNDLLTHNEFEKDGFLKDDCLLMKIIIEPK